jgi:hypothetical protein
MKKLFLLAFFIPAVTLAQWLEIGHASDAKTYYLSNKVDADEYKNIYVPVVTNYSKSKSIQTKNSTKSEYLSEWVLFMYGCKTNKYALVDYSFYSEPGAKGVMVGFDSQPPDKVKWHEVSFNNYSGDLVTRIKPLCSK